MGEGHDGDTTQQMPGESEGAERARRERTQAKARVSVQNEMLGQMRRRETHVDVYLMSGIRLDGVIEAFDQYSLVLRKGRSKQLVYKHAVSTVRPHGAERRGAGGAPEARAESRA